MKQGDKIRVKLDEGIYEYGKVLDIDIDMLGCKHIVNYIGDHGIEKEMYIEFVELVK
jgi:hypothetical protein